MDKQLIGIVSNYFSNISVVAFEITNGKLNTQCPIVTVPNPRGQSIITKNNNKGTYNKFFS